MHCTMIVGGRFRRHGKVGMVRKRQAQHPPCLVPVRCVPLANQRPGCGAFPLPPSPPDLHLPDFTAIPVTFSFFTSIAE
jgi:hypothetical protein